MSYQRAQLDMDGQQPLFRLLIDAVSETRTVTYKKCCMFLEKELDIPKVFSTHPGGVVGALMNSIHEIAPNAPLINVLVVQSHSGLPGSGANSFIEKRHGEHATKVNDTILKFVATETLASFNHGVEYWKEIYRKLYDEAYTPTSDDDEEQPTSEGGWGGPAESDEHKFLKEYIQKNPTCVGLPENQPTGILEQRLSSGDEVDVFFGNEETQVAVEVKSLRSGWKDIRRGIFQCVKYQAVLNAENLVLKNFLISKAILVTEIELPSDLKPILKRLRISHFVVSVNDKRRS